MQKQADLPAAQPSSTEGSVLSAENVVFGLIVTVFVVACVLAWWMIQRAGVPGAPGAPIG